MREVLFTLMESSASVVIAVQMPALTRPYGGGKSNQESWSVIVVVGILSVFSFALSAHCNEPLSSYPKNDREGTIHKNLGIEGEKLSC